MQMKVELKTGQIIEIRPPKKSDLKPLLKYINDLSIEKTFVAPQGVKYTLKKELEYLDKCIKEIKKGNRVQLFAFDKNILVANVSLERKKVAIENHICSLAMGVKKEYRDKGLGRILIKEIHSLAKKDINGLKICILTVFGNNDRAIHLYESFGYKKFGLLPKALQWRNKLVDHLYMYKNI
ncbi:MAG: N-acetyltransferase [bacterium]